MGGKKGRRGDEQGVKTASGGVMEMEREGEKEGG